MRQTFCLTCAGMCTEDDFRVKMAALNVMNNKADRTHEFGSKKHETMYNQSTNGTDALGR